MIDIIHEKYTMNVQTCKVYLYDTGLYKFVHPTATTIVEYIGSNVACSFCGILFLLVKTVIFTSAFHLVISVILRNMFFIFDIFGA